MGVVVAIDPGVTGAIGVIASRTGKGVDVIDVPVVQAKRKQLALSPYYLMLKDLEIDSAAVEEVNSHATGSIMTAFTFGITYIVPQCYFVTLGIPYDLILPNEWKKAYRLTNKDKDASRRAAMQYFPDLTHKFTRKQDHNRADAMLIARYQWEKYKNILTSSLPRVPLGEGR